LYLRLVLIVFLILLTFWPMGRYLWREHRWRWIIVHHTGSDTGDLAAIRKLHRQKGWKEAAYHFIINNGSRGTVAGQVQVTDRWKNRGNAGSTRRSYVNTFGIAVVLVGNLERHPPPLQQREALLNLLTRLARKYGIPPERIRGHGELQNTKCPGRYLDMPRIRREIQRRLAKNP
ncbi:MAG: N-acetylmuramoyl-L-alanine amidase, partial [Bacteroidetes bacterium]